MSNYRIIMSDAQRSDDDYLEHFGIKGMKWGVRRYQNPDGSLTDAGKAKYYEGSDGKLIKKNRHERAAYASRRDAADLRKHGFKKEADAVDKVANRQEAKGAAKRSRQNAWATGGQVKNIVVKGATAAGMAAGAALTIKMIKDPGMRAAFRGGLSDRDLSNATRNVAAITAGAEIVNGLLGYRKHMKLQNKKRNNRSAKAQSRSKKKTTAEINLNGEKWKVSTADPNNEMIKKALAKGAKVKYT